MNPLIRVTFIGMLAAAAFVPTVSAEDYGWFRYSPPDGWQVRELPPGVSYGNPHVEFIVVDPGRDDSARVQIRDVTLIRDRTERHAALYLRARLREERALARRGESPERSITARREMSALTGSNDAVYVERREGSRIRANLSHFVGTIGGRQFRVDFAGDASSFDTHRDAINSSLRSLSFRDKFSSTPTRSRTERLASLVEQRDDERLWLYDGTAAGAPLTDDTFDLFGDAALAGVTSLNVIAGPDATARGLDITDDALPALSGLPLTFLCLRGTLITDDGLSALQPMPLTTLVLGHTLVSGSGLRYLSRLPLEALDLANTDVGDDALVHLSGMPLYHLDLSHTNVSDRGLSYLRDLPLVHLAVNGTDVTADGLDSLIGTTLKSITVSSSISKEAAAAFTERHDIRVIRASG